MKHVIMMTSPLNQFEIYDLVSLAAPIMNLGIYLTNFVFYALITLIVLIAMFSSANVYLVPTR
jgi:hypothetical protein